MKYLLSLLILILVLLQGCNGIAYDDQDEAGTGNVFALESEAFADGNDIPPTQACDGENSSPGLSWEAPPEGTMAFAITMYDKDSSGGDFMHWGVYNLPENCTGLARSVPNVTQLTGQVRQCINDFGEPGYTGPCPPEGSRHTYVLTIYALDQPLELPMDAQKAQLLEAMQGHVLAQASLTGFFAR